MQRLRVLVLVRTLLWQDSSVLDVGCGDKPLAWDLRGAGYTGKICRWAIILQGTKRYLNSTYRTYRDGDVPGIGMWYQKCVPGNLK